MLWAGRAFLENQADLQSMFLGKTSSLGEVKKGGEEEKSYPIPCNRFHVSKLEPITENTATAELSC